MKNLALISLVLAITMMSFSLMPNACDSLLFFKEGASTTMTFYNNDGKVNGSTKTIYSKVSKSGSEISVTASQEHFDKKGKSGMKNDFTIKCLDGVLLFDMKMMLPDQQAESFKDMEMVIEGVDLEMPNNLQVGSTLKDANMKFSFKPKGDGLPIPMMSMEINVKNRKVEAKENVTTPAGTFECYKLSEEVETKSIFSTRIKSISWFSFDVGTVKTESYKENGKFMGRNELTAVSK